MADVLRKAHEFQEQLAAYALPGAIPLPFERSYLETTEGAILSALYMSDGKMRARFYDATGDSHRMETRWRIPWKDAAEVRLDGQEVRKLPVDGDHIRFDLPAWKIFTMAEGGKA